MPSEILTGILRTHPALVDYLVVLYVVGWFVGHVMRAAWPDETERSRGVRVVMAIADSAQLVFFSPLKSMVRTLREEPAPKLPEDPKP